MGKLKQSKLFNQLNNMSIRMSFVLYALFSLLIGTITCIFLISIIDSYRINLNYKYENMTARYDIPENGSFTAAYSNDQTKYTIFDTKGNEICKFNVDYQKERPVHEYVYPNHVSYIEVTPNFTNRDRLIDSVLGSLNIVIIPTILSISMICCVTFFYFIGNSDLLTHKEKHMFTEHMLDRYVFQVFKTDGQGFRKYKNLPLQNRRQMGHLHLRNNPYQEGHPRSCGECPRMSCLRVDYLYIFCVVSLCLGS